MLESIPSPTKFGRRPYISEEAVREALRALLYSDPDVPIAPSPLWQLTIVDMLMRDPSIPRADKLRHRLLGYVLVEEIERCAALVRLQCNASPLHPNESLTEIIADFKSIAGSGNAELKAWTLLYAKYVTVSAGLDTQIAAQALGIDERHCRRLQTHGIKRLVERLIEREWGARQQAKRYRLTARIPGEFVLHPVGRDELLRRGYQLLQEEGQKLLVTGGIGMGKKTVARALLRRMIDNDEIDQLLWLDSPTAADDVLLRIQECMSVEPTRRVDLDLILESSRFVLILSDLTELASDVPELERLLLRLRHARVILIHSRHLAISGITASCRVLPLDPSAQEAYFVQCWRRYHDTAVINEAEMFTMLQRSGGSPVLLRRLIQDYGYHGDGAVSGAQQLEALLSAVSRQSRDLLVAHLLCAAARLESAEFNSIWGEREVSAYTRELLAQHLLEMDASGGGPKISTAWLHRLQEDCRARGWTYERAGELLKAIDVGLQERHYACGRVAESLLSVDWIHVTDERAQLWLSVGWRTGVERGFWAGWLLHLRDATEGYAVAVDPRLWLGRGVCARYGAAIHESARAFQMAISLAGEAGDFGMQTEAMLERGILFRLGGHFGKAAQEMGSVVQKARRYQLDHLLQRAYLEQAQLALERENGAEILEILGSLPPTPIVTLMRAEAYSLSGDSGAALHLVEHLEPYLGENLALHARLHNLLGNAHRTRLDYSSARREFETVVTLLEQSDDLYSKARAYSNLGTAILEAGGERDEAAQLYRRAEVLQRETGDVLALYATAYNLIKTGFDDQDQ